MVMLAIIPILMGSGLAMQTAVNAKLRQLVGSPYLASAVSFTIGALFLIVLRALSGGRLMISMVMVINTPWWLWLGGLLGVIGLTVNILLFPRLGSIQTAVLPIFGQILMGSLIDQFGWFDSARQPLTGMTVSGLLLVTVGMLIATGVLSRRGQSAMLITGKDQWQWRLLGIGAGSLVAMQAAINGRLGVVLGSSLHAAMVSFTVGAVLLIGVVTGSCMTTRPLKTAVQRRQHYWWIWLGGFLGAAYVFGSAWLVPQIGTGQVVVIALFGQLFFSAIIEHFGWFETTMNRVDWKRLVGLVTMFLGVMTIHFL